MAVTRFTLLALCCLMACALGMPNSRILEGEDVNVSELPYVCSIRLDNAHVATGSIIGEKYIVTAAHPFSQLGATS